MSENYTKTDLVDNVAEVSQCSKTLANEIVTNAFNYIIDAVTNGKKVSIAKFGIFESKTRPERKGRNPRTGEDIVIKASASPVFKASKNFKDQLVVAE